MFLSSVFGGGGILVKMPSRDEAAFRKSREALILQQGANVVALVLASPTTHRPFLESLTS